MFMWLFRQRIGAKVQCTSCYAAYHPLCARAAGLHMEIVDGPENADQAVRLISYCPKHCTAHPELSGIASQAETLWYLTAVHHALCQYFGNASKFHDACIISRIMLLS